MRGEGEGRRAEEERGRRGDESGGRGGHTFQQFQLCISQTESNEIVPPSLAFQPSFV